MARATANDNARQKTYYESEVDRIAAAYGLPEYQYRQIRQSKDFMLKFYGEKIELDQMALAACMSRFHYIRLFQHVYGITPRQFLRDIRIGKAKELFKAGHAVAEVCYEIGYESVPTFSRAFKKGTGWSPAEYQRLHKSNRE
jgi:AraC-like DNA-binding protein